MATSRKYPCAQEPIHTVLAGRVSVKCDVVCTVRMRLHSKVSTSEVANLSSKTPSVLKGNGSNLKTLMGYRP
jgi:hypothetical protein